MSPLNHKRTTSSLAPPITCVAKKLAIKRQKASHWKWPFALKVFSDWIAFQKRKSVSRTPLWRQPRCNLISSFLFEHTHAHTHTQTHTRTHAHTRTHTHTHINPLHLFSLQFSLLLCTCIHFIHTLPSPCNCRRHRIVLEGVRVP